MNTSGFRNKYVLLTGAFALAVAGIGFYILTSSPTEPFGLWNKTDNGVAIRGYDTVAYFTESKPVKGSETFSHTWSDATWHFSNQRHREMFIADPEQYVPEFGGFCAAALTYGQMAKADPEVWAIVDGKLFLNYDKYALELFHEKLEENVAKSKKHWAEKLEAEKKAQARIAKAS